MGPKVVAYRPGDIVWINLGHSYGWWPAQVQDATKKPKLSQELLNSINILTEDGTPEDHDSVVENESHEVICFVKFFDDETFEWRRVTDRAHIQPYSGKNKIKFIKAGFKRFQEKKQVSVFGSNLSIAQFYKDVEISEVMTDNNPEVADILCQYEFMENDGMVEESDMEVAGGAVKNVESKKDKKEKKSAKKIKQGRISKPKAKVKEKRVLKEKTKNVKEK